MNEAKPFCISKKEVWEAYKRVKENNGAAGVDEQTIEDVEKRLKKNLYKIWNRMSSGSYFPPPVRTVKIPKKTGGKESWAFPIARPFTRRCVNWIEIWPSGPNGNTRNCHAISSGQRTGSHASRDALRRCLPIGRWGSGVAPCWELYESRGSRTVLREPRGETPRGDSPAWIG